MAVGEIRREQVEPLVVGALDPGRSVASCRARAAPATLHLGLDAQQIRARPLRVEVPQQRRRARARGEVGEVHRGGGLPHPAFDVVAGEDHGAQSLPTSRVNFLRLEVRGAATVCPRCGTDNLPGAKFCMECGSALPTSCPACGHATAPGQNFCSECGAGAGVGRERDVRRPGVPRERDHAGAVAGARPAGLGRAADGVGPVRRPRRLHLARRSRSIPRTCATCSGTTSTRRASIVDRYGGTIEKFIGDAVDGRVGNAGGARGRRRADRAGRARAGRRRSRRSATRSARPDLRARAGVVTGQAALLANHDEGVVVGDRVNTAARIQAAADPGTVLVDDVTRQVTSAAIVYEDAGRHELKGKAEPLRLWRATEVLAPAPGHRRATASRREFVGRDADLRLIKELFHAGVSRRSARLVAVSGAAGVGKSRLRWEFLDYLMTLPDRFLWHPGRCLPYGDGVAYWALAEMVRHRLGIREDAPDRGGDGQARRPASSDGSPTPPSASSCRSRLGVLLGVAEPGPGREELFAGWRLFFERLAEHDPVVMVFEDMHWADDGLLDFVEYLLDWSAQHRDLHPDVRPARAVRAAAGLAGGPPQRHRRSRSSRSATRAMEELLDSVATLPVAAKRRIISQAEGIPLYAIETVRALADRGALVERDGALVLAGELGELDVPASLISLLGARLDALGSDERELVKSMSVFGGNFPLAAAQALSGLPARRSPTRCCVSLVRKQVLTVRADPLSPDRGPVPLRPDAAAHRRLRDALQARAEVPAPRGRAVPVACVRQRRRGRGRGAWRPTTSQAYRCAANDSDAIQLRAEAVTALRRGAQRAAAVGAPHTAERAYRTAIELAAGEDERIELIKAAGDMALVDGRYEASLELFEDAAARLQSLGRARDAARLGSKIGQALRRVGRAAEAIDRMRHGPRRAERRRRGSRTPRRSTSSSAWPCSRPAGCARPPSRSSARSSSRRRSSFPRVLAGALTYKAQLCDAVGRVARGAHPVRRRDRAVPAPRADRPAVRRAAQRRGLPAQVRPARRRRAHQRRAGHREAHRQPLLRERRGVQPDARAGSTPAPGTTLERLGVELLDGGSRATGRRGPSSRAGAAGRARGDTQRRARAPRRDGRLASQRGRSAALDLRGVRGDDRARGRRLRRRARPALGQDGRDHRDRGTGESGQPDRLSVRARRRARARADGRGGRSARRCWPTGRPAMCRRSCEPSSRAATVCSPPPTGTGRLPRRSSVFRSSACAPSLTRTGSPRRKPTSPAYCSTSVAPMRPDRCSKRRPRC